MENGKIHLEIMLPEEFDDLKPYGIKTETWQNRVYANCRLKNADGTPIEINTDMLGKPYRNTIGPISKLKSGNNRGFNMECTVKHIRDTKTCPFCWICCENNGTKSI